MLRDIKARYGALESWGYDHFIAPAVEELAAQLWGELLDRMPEGAAVLEVGCGGGQLAHMVAARRDDVTWTGLDLSAEQIARARRRAGDDDRISFVCGNALDLPFEDASFDTVVSVGSIKHWPDPSRGLRECLRVLRPGGHLVVVDADRGCRFEDAARFVDSWPIPRLFRLGSLAFFRTAVAGRSLDLDDGRALLEDLPLQEREVRRLSGTPALVMIGRK
jgi:SAM-dependent methyltransferase